MLKDFPLLGQVRFATGPGIFIGRANYFDDGDNAESRLAVQNSNVCLMYLQTFDLNDDGGIAISERNRAAAGFRLHPSQPDIWNDLAVGTFQPHPLIDGGNVAGPQLRLQVVGKINDEPIMESRPNLRLLQIGIHSWKDRAHTLHLRRGLWLAQHVKLNLSRHTWEGGKLLASPQNFGKMLCGRLNSDFDLTGRAYEITSMHTWTPCFGHRARLC